MSNRNSSILNMIRGGQTIAHFIGMAKQVAGYIFIFGGLGFLTTFSIILYFRATFMELLGWVNYAQAAILVDFRERPADTMWFLDDGLHGMVVEAHQVYNTDSLAFLYQRFNEHLLFSAIAAGVVLTTIIVFCVRFILIKGKQYSSDELIRGSHSVTEAELKLIIDTKIAEEERLHKGDIHIGQVNVPSEWETQNIFMIGGPGSGKTVLYRKWLSAVRATGRRAIIHDRSGTYLEKFYREGKDIILNPLDLRTADWCLFDECKYLHQFEMIAETLFPETSKGDPFWYEAPRLIFTSLALKEAEKAHPSASLLSKRVLTCPLDDLIKICKGTFAQSVIDKNVVKQSQTLRSIVATKMRCLTLYDDNVKRGFSIRDWVLNADGDATIFITSNREMDAYLKPLITIWLEIASTSILSLPEDLSRRIWLFFDELHALGKIKSLASTLADIRKYGGCAVLGFQGYAQAKAIYEESGVDSLADSCATYIFLRANNSSSAEWMSNQLGKSDTYEAHESLSYGQERVRDGVNMSVNRNAREIVMPTQLQNLPDLHGYLKFGRALPIAPFVEQFKDMQVIAPAFIENTSKFQTTMKDFLIEGEGEVDTTGEPTVHELDNEHHADLSLMDDLYDHEPNDLVEDFHESDDFALDDVVMDEDR